MPILVEKPPEGEEWIREVKCDGYRSQFTKDEGGVRIFTRRGLDCTARYRDLAKAAGDLNVENATLNGDIIVLNEARISDFGPLRNAITSRQHDLYFVAFDLLHLNGHDLRDVALEDCRDILADLIPPHTRIHFYQPLPGHAAFSTLSSSLGWRAWCRSAMTVYTGAAHR
ncbi:hypothetical protein [Mesorhizobium sp. BR115XR7A]|uniref:ATP-dependent DNA ligase n=1 Tax=Mesorhizobium sp. BR115XR7A TaxID=2876645 RepID=UPI0029623064|nr:hypothetical protein [Mesorhizobium sp. BR115XR7A]